MRDNPTIKWSDLIEPDESLDRLYDMLTKLETEYNKLSSNVINSSKQMKDALNGITSAQNSASNVVGLTQQAQDVKKTVNAMQEMVKAMAQAKAASSNLTQEMLGGSSSVKTLTATLRDNMRAFEELTLKEKDNALAKKRGSAEARSYLDKVSSMRVQIESTTRALKAYTTEIKKEAIGNMEVEKTVIKLTKKERELLQLSMQRAEASKRARKMEELDAKIASTKEGSYARLNAEYKKGILLLEQMSQEEQKLAKDNGFIEALKTKAREMRRFEEETGNFYLGDKGRLNKMWNGLDFSVAQIVREMPNMAFGARTFIMALSNNFGELFDQIRRFKMAQADLAARGEKTTSVWKRLGQSLLSLNTIVMAAVTVFTLFGETWWKAIKDWFSGINALDRLDRAFVKFADDFKSISGSLNNDLYAFSKLRMEWNNLTDDLSRTEWLNNNAEAFKKLGLIVRDTADATDIFTRSQEKMMGVLKNRMMLEAAERYMKKKYDDLAKEVAENEADRNKAVSQKPGWWESNVFDPIGRSFIPGYGKDYTSGATVAKLPQGIKDQIVNDLLEKANSMGYGDYLASTKALMGKDLSPNSVAGLQMFAQNNARFAVVFNDYLDTIKKQSKIAGEQEKDAKSAEALVSKMQEKVNKDKLDIAKSYFGIVKNDKGVYVYASDTADNTYKKGDLFGIQDEGAILKWYETLANASQSSDEYSTLSKTGLYGLTENQKYKFSKLSKRQGSGGKGPEGMDFDAWYARVDEAYRHKRAEAEAKADKADWERKIKLIDERYEHEKVKMKELRRQANDILSGKTKVKGGVTAERRDKLVEFIGKYDGLDQSLDDARMTEITDVINKRMVKQIEHEKAIVDIKLKGAEKGSQKERELQQQRLEFEKQLAVLRNELLPESERVSKEDILKGYELQRKELNKAQKLNLFSGYTNDYISGRATEKQQRQNQRPMYGFNNRQQELYDIQTQKDLLEYERERLQIELEYTDDLEKQVRLNKQIADLRDKYDELDLQEQDRKGVKGLLGSIANRGSVGGGILDMMGMDDKVIDAAGNATDKIVGYIGDIIDANAKLAESAVKTQETRVKAAQTALDAELEASKNGFANRVVSAQEELKLEKQKLKEQKREREKALKAQRAMDTAEAASSLTVALAQLWKSCINTSGPFGVPLAIALSAVMLGAFVTSRVKARQASQQDAEYGEGGIEFLDGGSHASGNDIDLHTKNKDGRNMRAEGGEALAIINRRNTRKYRKVLPDVIDSLNRGVFEEKYLKAFESGDQLHAQIITTPVYPQADLSKLENKLDKLISQGENKVISLPNGNTIEYIGNVKRIVKKND